jgi:hypothetical protein
VRDAFELLQKRLQDLLLVRAEAVSTGGAKDYGEYQRMVGVIEGLTLAERELLDIQGMVETADD